MPDPQRPLRRLTHARSLSRAVTHVAVIGLVAFAAAFGIAAVRGPSTGSAGSTNVLLPFDLVARVRGAADAAPAARTSTFDLEGGRVDPRLQSRAVHVPVSTPEPTPAAHPRRPAPARSRPARRGRGPAHRTQRGRQRRTDLAGAPGSSRPTTAPSHMALDIAAPPARTVIASAAGVVTWAGWRTTAVASWSHRPWQRDRNGLQPPRRDLWAPGPVPSSPPAQGIAAVGCTGVVHRPARATSRSSSTASSSTRCATSSPSSPRPAGPRPTRPALLSSPPMFADQARIFVAARRRRRRLVLLPARGTRATRRARRRRRRPRRRRGPGRRGRHDDPRRPAPAAHHRAEPGRRSRRRSRRRMAARAPRRAPARPAGHGRATAPATTMERRAVPDPGPGRAAGPAATASSWRAADEAGAATSIS